MLRCVVAIALAVSPSRSYEVQNWNYAVNRAVAKVFLQSFLKRMGIRNNEFTTRI